MKTWLKNTFLYQKLRFSKWWLAVFSPGVYREVRREAQFYKALFHAHQVKGIVFDIGANLGFTTQAFLDGGAERVIAVEPDSFNIGVLRARFGRNPRVAVLPCAVSNMEGKTTLWRHTEDSALHTLEPKWMESVGSSHYEPASTIRTITLDGMIREYGMPSFVKVDVEGHEWGVLRGLGQAVPFLSFEVNLPEFEREMVECLQYLEKLSPDYLFQCHTGFEAPAEGWMVKHQAISVIKTQKQVRCWEIFAKLNNHGSHAQ